MTLIRRAQKLGFSLKEISELLSLQVKADDTCEEVKKRAEKKLDAIEEKIQTLGNMKRVLIKLTAACEARIPSEECPILEALEQ